MTSSRSQANFVLALHCPDRPGIVHAVTGFLMQAAGNIVQSQQYGDAETGSFFLRVHFELTEESATVDELRTAFAPTGEQFAMTWDMWDHAARYNTLIMVSRSGHCLNDLLFRWSTGALQIDIPAVSYTH